MKLRPRFCLRTLVILVTLVCAYFAAWELTRRHNKWTTGPPLPIANCPGPFVLIIPHYDSAPQPNVSRVYFITFGRKEFKVYEGPKRKR